MNRIRKDSKAVSPVIATILMVAITVVLAGVLVVYLQTLPSSGGNVETSLGLRADAATGGGWVITIVSGSKDSTSVTIQCINPLTGVQRYSNLLRTGGVDLNTANVQFFDNNADQKVNAGDTVNLKAAGTAVAGDKVQFLKGGDTIIGTISSLPS